MNRDEQLINLIALEIMSASDAFSQGMLQEEELPTAPELARKFDLRLENVKKKLRILKQAGLIHPISMSPKRYRFDQYVFEHLTEDHPLYAVLYMTDEEKV